MGLFLFSKRISVETQIALFICLLRKELIESKVVGNG